MRYKKNVDFTHGQEDKIGVLITNLGTPEAPTKKALRRYLKEFLLDPRVVEIPKVIWWCILHFFILPTRPAKSAAAYSSIWTEDGSPLMFHTKAQRDAIALKLVEHYGDKVVIDFAMRYGTPSISSGLNSLFSQGARKLLILPLYPQYCASTVASTFDAVAKDFSSRRWLPDVRFITHYHDRPDYIQALAQSIQAHWSDNGRADKLVLSYHGIPKRYLLQGDPYFCECHKTSRLLAEALELKEDDYITTFQSRFGKAEWLQPYTDETLKKLPSKGVKSVQVVCPGFSSDCLETIEEISEENREYFIESGGNRYEYIQALNSDNNHIEMLFELVKDNIQGWHCSDDIEQRIANSKRQGSEY